MGPTYRVMRVFGVLSVLAIGAFVLSPALAAEEHEQKKRGEKGDIVETASQKEQFSTLVEAINQAELAETLKGEGPYTVFAPTNDAFNKLPQDKLDALLQPENRDQLRDVLTYHVISGKVMASDVLELPGVQEEGADVSTLQGSPATLQVHDETVMINEAQVIKTDIETTNGVIHVIDTVLVPEQ